MNNKLNLASWNVGGITSPQKRKKILKQLKRFKVDIAFLQETHLNKIELGKLKTDWVGKVVGTPCSNRKKGVAFLFHKKIQFKILNTEIDQDERYLIMLLEIAGTKFTFCNIYGPNKTDNAFWGKLQSKLLPYFTVNLIVAGDLNIVKYPTLDRLKPSLNKNSKQEAKIFKNFSNLLHLHDIWQIQNPDLKKFSCESHAYRTLSRLDYFLVSDKMLRLDLKPEIQEILISDHAIITLQIKIRNPQEMNLGRLFFPRHLVANVQFKAWLRLKWIEFKQINETSEIKTELLWETFKAVIRGEIKAYLVVQKRKQMARDLELASQLRNVFNSYISDPSEVLWLSYQKVKKERELFLTQKVAQDDLRKRFFFYRHGGKAGKALANLTRAKKKKEPITAIKTPETRITNNSAIQSYICKYFKEVYSETLVDTQAKSEFWGKIGVPRLEKSSLDELNLPITLLEVTNAIKKLASNKAAGPDQLPAELYKLLAEDIAPLLVSLFNQFFIQNNLRSKYFAASLITLILKKNKNPEEIGSYRPISLLNSDYKLLMSIIAQRFKHVIGSLIHKDQVGFMPGRNSSRNLRKLQLILNIYHKQVKTELYTTDLDAAIVSIDAEKAFDSITWDHLFTALKKYGVEGPFFQFIQVIYQLSSAAVIINDTITDYFPLYKGSRQGCPLSPYLFNLALEPLAIQLRKELEGIKIGKRRITTLLYADDLLVMLSNTKKNIPTLNQILHDFGVFSGYKVNLTKTEIYWLKKNKDSLQISPFRETKDHFTYLGIKLSIHFEDWYDLNYPPIFLKIKHYMEKWAKFKLTLTGKTNLIKMLLFPKLLYLMQNLPIIIKKKDLIRFKQECTQFLWGGKRKAISYKKLMLFRTEGGLGLPDIEIYNLVCIGKIALDWLTETDYYAALPLERVLVYPFSLNALLHIPRDKRPHKIRDLPVIQMVITAWQKILHILHIVSSFSNHLPIVGNPNFTPALDTNIFKIWAQKGITNIAQLIDKNTWTCKTFAKIKEDYEINNKEFYAFLQIRHYIQELLQNNLAIDAWDPIEPILKLFKAGRYSISTIYRLIISNNGTSNLQKLAEIWLTPPERIQESFRLIDRATVSSSWRETHTKFINRAYITPQVKAKWDKSMTPCQKCKSNSADLQHCFWYCYKIKRFWYKIGNWISKINQCNFQITDKNVFFFINQEETDIKNIRQLNNVIITGRLLILKYWKSKKAPSLKEFKQKLQNQIILEQIDTSVNSEAQVKNFFYKWKSVITSLPENMQRQVTAPFRGTIYMEQAIENKEYPI
ncbi:ankyrin repeat domain-containing protein SOWAHD isoform X1 [Bombina bombina]|uniref:ankyrin repeat domain-containing protein SOWAHD isoform X1 n=1 Tax=Bombina bombina TaxID=8345 RepID=UPI00235A67B7|nr:ankyrin repeat domain-containing protein SOWAHD isoform X1 [Bombina bombina]XP_053555165.1 ankyrin repeat domain-containing protein SOWAHD isoform X1 [Bombina bombina]